jgi:hypothetical protein
MYTAYTRGMEWGLRHGGHFCAERFVGGIFGVARFATPQAYLRVCSPPARVGPVFFEGEIGLADACRLLGILDIRDEVNNYESLFTACAG